VAFRAAQCAWQAVSHLELAPEAGLEKREGAEVPPNSEEPDVDVPKRLGEEEGGAKLKPEEAAAGGAWHRKHMIWGDQ